MNVAERILRRKHERMYKGEQSPISDSATQNISDSRTVLMRDGQIRRVGRTATQADLMRDIDVDLNL